MANVTGVEQDVQSGFYNIQIEIGTGTAVLKYATDELGFIDVPDSSVSASTGISIDLPLCRLKATLTGDAVVSINEIRK